MVGIGGLGTPAMLALSLHAERLELSLTIVEHDTVEESNLNRQFLYRSEDVGRSKAEVAQVRISELGIQARVVEGRVVDDGNWVDFITGYSLVLDCTDSVQAKSGINSLCVKAGATLVHAAVQGWEGQVTTILPGISSCYRCIFREVPEEGEIVKPPEAGIMGAMSGFVGLMQAKQALSFFSGDHEALFVNRLVTFDMRRQRIRSVNVDRWDECPVCGGARE